MLPCVCSEIDHRGRQNVVRTSETHSAIALCTTFSFLQHFDVICDLLLNRRKEALNPFVKQKHGFKPISARICFGLFSNARENACVLIIRKCSIIITALHSADQLEKDETMTAVHCQACGYLSQCSKSICTNIITKFNSYMLAQHYSSCHFPSTVCLQVLPSGILRHKRRQPSLLPSNSLQFCSRAQEHQGLHIPQVLAFLKNYSKLKRSRIFYIKNVLL